MIWGQSFWGYWWTWSPRLTFTLVLLVLYLGYLVMRALINQEPKRSVASAVYGLLAFLDVPLLYMSARLLPDVHPTSIPLNGPMKFTLLVCLLPTGLLLLWLILRPWRIETGRRTRESAARPGFQSGGPRMA
jgi:heme exporter protein C